MKNLIFILLLIVIGISAKSQVRFPTGFPSQFNTGWNKWGYAMSDSGTIIANRDTNWLAKYSGTVVFKPSNKQFYWFDSTNLTWNLFGSTIDTTSLSNRINLKLNISDTALMLLPYLRKADTTNKWVQDVYVRNDSLFKFKNGTETFLDTLGNGGSPGSGLTSVGLSLPSAFTVTNSPLTSNGTLNVIGAGTTLQYIRGNGTLATTDTGMIPNFHLKVRSLFSGTSPITFNQTTGIIGINNATATGTKGAATFTGAFSDNGSGTIDLLTLGSAGSCTGCDLTIDEKGRITGYADGPGGATDNVNIGTGFRILNSATQEMRTIFAGFGTAIDSVSNANGLTWRSDTTRVTGLPTYFYVDSLFNIPGENISNASLTANGNYIQNWNHKQLRIDTISLLNMNAIETDAFYTPLRSNFRFTWSPNIRTTGIALTANLRNAANSADSVLRGLSISELSNQLLYYRAGHFSFGQASENADGAYFEITGSNTNIAKASTVRAGAHSLLLFGSDSVLISATSAASADTILAIDPIQAGGVHKLLKIPYPSGGGGGSGLSYIYSATAPTGSDTGKIWIKTPLFCGVYDVYTYASLQFSWIRFGWLSMDGLFSTLPPLNIVIAGQSNAAGLYSGGDTARTKGIIGYSSGAINGGIDDPTAWQPVYIGISPFYLDNNNIAHAFAKQAQREAPRIVRIIGTYLGGIGIGSWNGRTSVGTTPPYMLDTLRQRLTRSGIDTIHCILWAHGESAYPTSDVNGGYYADFKVLQDSLFSPLTAGVYRTFTTIVACGMANDTSSTAVYSGASQPGGMMRLANDSDPYTNFAGAWGVSLCDDTHFCGTALDTIGRRSYSAFKNMPRDLLDEQPKYSYDWVNDKIGFPTRISAYANGMTAQNIQGINLGWTNNTNALFSINGSTGVTFAGNSLTWPYTPTAIFNVSGAMAVAYGQLNSLIAGNITLTGSLERVTMHSNYLSTFSNSVDVTDATLIGANAGYNTTRVANNSVIIGANAGNGMTPAGFGDFPTIVGAAAFTNSTANYATVVGARACQSCTGSTSVAFGMDATYSSFSNSGVFGYQTSADLDNQINLGNSSLVQLRAGTKRFRLDQTPSDGQVWTYNSGTGVSELATPTSGSQTWQQTLTTGSTFTGNNTITGANTNFTWNDVNTFRINTDVYALAKADGSGPYSHTVIGAPQQLWIGYTPTVGVYSKGAAVIIDTNNNVSLGSGIITSSHPLYTYGSVFAQGFTSSRGNFYKVDNYTADQTISIEQYWINIDATSGNVTITLPAASAAFGAGVGIQYVFSRVDNSGNTVTISRAGSDTINGATTTTLAAQYNTKEIQCTSTSTWAIKSSF